MTWHKAPPCASGRSSDAVWWGRRFRLPSATLALLLLAAFTAPAAQPPVTIYRDTYPVPHIYRKTGASVVFGLMYAQAEDNFWQLEEDCMRALGRAAEVDGPNERASDILVRAWETEKRARGHYAHADTKLRALCDAFADGVNHCLARRPAVHPRRLTRWEPWFILAEEHRGPAGAALSRAQRDRAFPAMAEAGAIDRPEAVQARMVRTRRNQAAPREKVPTLDRRACNSAGQVVNPRRIGNRPAAAFAAGGRR